MTGPDKLSPRFLFCGASVKAVQDGPDSFHDILPAPGGDLTAANGSRKVNIQLPGRGVWYETSMDWPSSGEGLVEIAPAVLEALDKADPHQSDNTLRQLRDHVVDFLS